MNDHEAEFDRSVSRWLAAFLVTVGVFFGAVGIGVVTSPVDGSPLAAAILRAFGILLFGSISLGALAGAVGQLRGAPPLPAEVRARCLVCGERCPADAACPLCGAPPGPRRVDLAPGDGGLFMGGLLSSGLPLGAGFLLLPYEEGETRLLVWIAVAAFALLLCAVGTAGVWVAVRGLRPTRGLEFVLDDREEYSAGGQGRVLGARLLWLRGSGQRERTHLPSAAPDPEMDPAATTLAMLIAAGVLRVRIDTDYDWRVEGERLERTVRQAARVVVTRPLDDTDTLRAFVAVFAASLARGEPTLHDLAVGLEVDARGAQLHVHARALAAAGVEVAPELVGAIGALLREGGERLV